MLVSPSAVGDLVRALQRLVDPLYHRRHAVRRVKALVGIHLPGEIRVRRDLPSAQVNCFQSGPHLLHCLVAGQRAERSNERLGLEQVPSFSAPRRARVCSGTTLPCRRWTSPNE